MNPRNVIALSAIAALGLASLLGDAVAQQKSVKETIVGTWSVTSIYDLYDDGKKTNPWGAGMKGSFTFDNNGRFTQILIGEVVPALKSADPRAADSPSLAFIGSYTGMKRTRPL
jgi:Lipocalin-like domain